MRRVVICLSFMLLGTYIFSQNAHLPWGNEDYIRVMVSIQKGLATSAWTDRGDIARMLRLAPVGDGTYINTEPIWLVAGADYNYIFFSSITRTLMGYPTHYVAAEPIPNGPGQILSDPAFFVTKSTINPTAPANLITDNTTGGGGPVRYVSIGGDARRNIKLPSYLTSDTTIYVYHNFGSYETGVNLIDIQPSLDRVELWWQGAIGWWTRGMPSFNVVSFSLYVATNSPGGPYSPLAMNMSYNTTYYSHTGITPGNTYYYVFVTSDAYRGVTSKLSEAFTATSNWGANLPKSEWANFARTTDTVWMAGYPAYDPSSMGGLPVPVYFKVEGADEKYIAEHGNIVYLTPVGVDGRFWPWKLPVRLYSVYVPKQEG